MLLDAGGFFSGSELLFPLFGGNASAEAFAASRYDAAGLNWRDFVAGAPPAGAEAYVREWSVDLNTAAACAADGFACPLSNGTHNGSFVPGATLAAQL